jgi:RNA polymerase sigma-70 factor (ECF subfamily)
MSGSSTVSPDLALERMEQKEIIQDALSRLPESYRLILVMRYQLDLSNQEIADALGISRENTEVRLYRARQALRKVLSSPNIGGFQDEMPANR